MVRQMRARISVSDKQPAETRKASAALTCSGEKSRVISSMSAAACLNPLASWDGTTPLAAMLAPSAAIRSKYERPPGAFTKPGWSSSRNAQMDRPKDTYDLNSSIRSGLVRLAMSTAYHRAPAGARADGPASAPEGPAIVPAEPERLLTSVSSH